MDTEKLTAALHKKMSAEQDKFRAWLVAQPPEEILNHTVEYTTREDILMAMDFNVMGVSPHPTNSGRRPFPLSLREGSETSENVPPRYAIVRRNEWMVRESDVVISGVTHGWGGENFGLCAAQTESNFSIPNTSGMLCQDFLRKATTKY